MLILIIPPVVWFLAVLSLIIVASVILGKPVPAPVIVVAPCSVIPFVIFRCEVQLNVPAGSLIVSPFNAALCKDCTSATDPSEW